MGMVRREEFRAVLESETAVSTGCGRLIECGRRLQGNAGASVRIPWGPPRARRVLRCAGWMHVASGPRRRREGFGRRSSGRILPASSAYRLASPSRWPNSGRMSRSRASRTAAGEPGMVKTSVSRYSPPTARLSMAAGPTSSKLSIRNSSP